MPRVCVIADAQRAHPAISPYFDFHLSGSVPDDLDPRDVHAFKVEASLTYVDGEGALRRTVRASGTKGPLVLPPQYRTHAFHECHDRLGHLGTAKTWATLRRLYWWPRARDDVRMYVRLCRACRRAKVPRHGVGTARIVNNGSSPWSHVTCDVYDVGWSSGDFTKVLAFIDQFSRGVLVVPLKTDHTSADIADAFVHMLMRFHGRPLSVRSDRGSVLISELISQLYEVHKVEMDDGTAYHHTTAGICERFFSTLKGMLLTHRIASKDDQWHLYLPLLEMAYNQAINETTGLSPFFISHLRHPDLALDVFTGRPYQGEGALKSWIADHLERMIVVWEVCAKQLGLQAVSRKKERDLHRETRITYTPGQQVLLLKGRFVDGNLPKGEEPTDGPYTILRSLPQGNYVLGDLRSRRMHDVINEERLMPWPTRRLSGNDEIGQRRTIQRIVDRRPFTDRDGHTLLKYRVRWAGWHKMSDSWRTEGELRDVAPLVHAFNLVKPLDEAHLATRGASQPLDCAAAPAEAPPVADSALAVRHFRPLDGGIVSPPPTATPVDFAQQFPVNARVEMLYMEDDGSTKWYEGVITRSVPTVSARGIPDLSYSIRFPGERVRSYKLSRNSLRPLPLPPSSSPPPSPSPSPPSSPPPSPPPSPPSSPSPSPPSSSPSSRSSSPPPPPDTPRRRVIDYRQLNYLVLPPFDPRANSFDMSLHEYGGGLSVPLRSFSLRRARAIAQRRRNGLRCFLQVPTVAELGVCPRQHVQLCDQAQEPCSTISWAYYYVDAVDAQSTLLSVWDNIIHEYTVFFPEPLLRPSLGIPGISNRATHVLRMHHRYDGRCFTTTKVGPCLYCRQRLHNRRCSACNEYTFCSEQCNRLGYSHFHKGACRAIESRRVITRVINTTNQDCTLLTCAPTAYDQNGHHIRYPSRPEDFASRDASSSPSTIVNINPRLQLNPMGLRVYNVSEDGHTTSSFDYDPVP